MNLNTSAVETTDAYLRQNRELHARVPGAINAGHRMKLLEEINLLTEQFTLEMGLSQASPPPLPDFPVFDLRAMDDVITREKELELLAAIEQPQFSLQSKIGLAIAVGILFLTTMIIVLQVRSYQENIQPAITTQDGRRAQVKAYLAAIGDREEIQSATTFEDLENRLLQHRNAVRELSLGGTDETLENQLNERRDLIKNRIKSLSKERN